MSLRRDARRRRWQDEGENRVQRNATKLRASFRGSRQDDSFWELILDLVPRLPPRVGPTTRQRRFGKRPPAGHWPT